MCCYLELIIILLALIVASVFIAFYDCLSKLREKVYDFEEIYNLFKLITELNNKKIDKQSNQNQLPQIPSLEKFSITCFYCGRVGHIFYYCHFKDDKTEESDHANDEANYTEDDNWE